jgi:hypothetical protein
MAKLIRVGDEIVLELSFWEKLAALHSNPRALLASIEKIEFVDQLWGSSTLRGVRAPGTALPFVVLYGTLRGLKYRDFVAMKGRGEGAVISFKNRTFARWIFTLTQKEDEIRSLLTP